MCDYLSNIFPNRWIDRPGGIEQRVTFPDLVSFDYFWDDLKFNNIDDLKERSRNEIRLICTGTLNSHDYSQELNLKGYR